VRVRLAAHLAVVKEQLPAAARGAAGTLVEVAGEFGELARGGADLAGTQVPRFNTE